MCSGGSKVVPVQQQGFDATAARIAFGALQEKVYSFARYPVHVRFYCGVGLSCVQGIKESV